MRIAPVVAMMLVLSVAGRAAAEEPLVAEEEVRVDSDIPMAPILLTSFSAVAVAVGAGFGWQASNEYDDWEDARQAGDLELMDSLEDDVHKHSVTANVLMFGGLIGMGIGIVWWIVAAKDDDGLQLKAGASTASWSPSFGPDRAGFSITF